MTCGPGDQRLHLERLHADAQIRRAHLHQLEQIAAGFPTRERFLTELTLDPPNATSDQADAPLLDEDYLILSTIHSAKGQEWKSVYVLNVVDGCIPSDMATDTPAQIEEERRLLYVAMTRAKDDLHLIIPQRFFTHQQAATGDRHVFASRTRFIPSGILDRFACSAWPAAHRQDHSTTRSRITVAIDLKTRMRGMWALKMPPLYPVRDGGTKMPRTDQLADRTISGPLRRMHDEASHLFSQRRERVSLLCR